ncbi:hypothetical protein ACFX1X_004674 [Malus domestica]
MRDILEKFNMDKCNIVNTSVANGLKLSKEEECEFVNSTVYKSLVGNLRYLTITIPNIVYGVGLVSRYMETPRESHWLAAKRILRYIRVQHGRSKHIDTRFHFLRDHVKQKTIELVYCHTKEQVADIFTKPLPVESFQLLREMLGMKTF